jgi:hypothetical protein
MCGFELWPWRTEANCLPATTPLVPSNYPWRLVQYPTHTKATHIFMLFEANIHSFRQIMEDIYNENNQFGIAVGKH